MLIHGLGLGSMSLCAAGASPISQLTTLLGQIQEQTELAGTEDQMTATAGEALQVIEALEPADVPAYPTTESIRKLIAKPEGLRVGVSRLEMLIQQITGKVPSLEEAGGKPLPTRRQPTWVGRVAESLDQIPEPPSREPTAQRMTTRRLRDLATEVISDAWPLTLQITAARPDIPLRLVNEEEMILAGSDEALAVNILGTGAALIIIDDLQSKHYVAHVMAETALPVLVRSLKSSFEILQSRRLFVLPGTNFALDSVVRIFETLNEYGVMGLHERVTKLIPHKDCLLPRMLILEGNFYDCPTALSEPPAEPTPA